MTRYQRLKQENFKLKRELREVILNPSSHLSSLIIARHKFVFQEEEVFMLGSGRIMRAIFPNIDNVIKDRT